VNAFTLWYNEAAQSFPDVRYGVVSAPFSRQYTRQPVSCRGGLAGMRHIFDTIKRRTTPTDRTLDSDTIRRVNNTMFKAICYKWFFPPKLQVINDEFHPRYLYPHGVLADVSPAPGRSYTRATWPPRGRGRGESLLSPRRIDAKLRAAEVIELRFQGCSWQAIANRLGFRDRSGPWRACRRLYDRLDYDRYMKRRNNA